MSDNENRRGSSGKVLGVVLSAIAGGLAVALLVLAGALWYLGSKVTAGAETYVRNHVFTDPARASFDKIGFHWLGGGLSLRGLQLHPPSANGLIVEVRTDEISVPLPLRDLLSGTLDVTRVRIDKPQVRIVISSAAAVREDAPEPAAFGGLSQFGKAPLSAISIKDGSVSIEYQGGAQPLVIEAINVDFSRAAGDDAALTLSGSAQIAQSPKGTLSIDAKFYEPDPFGHFEGEIKLNEIPVAALGGMLPPDPDVRYQSGSLTIKSQFNCKNGWLTASLLVDINDVKVDASPKRDKVFGVSAKYLKDLDHMSFDLPMSGSLSAPEIDFATGLHQILTKILREKFTDREKADELAAFFANSIGGKIDKSLKAWLKRKKKS